MTQPLPTEQQLDELRVENAALRRENAIYRESLMVRWEILQQCAPLAIGRLFRRIQAELVRGALPNE